MSGNAARNTHNVVFRELTNRLQTAAVLVAPCGDGQLSGRMRDAGFDVVGLDIDSPPDSGAVEFRQADLNLPLPVSSAEFDVVVSVEGIEHLQRPFDFIRECRRALRPDGLLIITTPNISSLRSRWRWFMTGFHYKCKYALDEKNPSPMHHINMLSYHKLRYILHTSGFEITKITTNRIKAISWIYLPLAPFAYLYSRLVLAKARPSEINYALSQEVPGQMTKSELLFGELMILVARPTAGALIDV
jgi:2-polyprenyl-3-methyl-5-hydroxy-6-metoxy-1,4-benzoquinol methylase